MARNRITNSQYLQALALVEHKFPGTLDNLKAGFRAIIESDTQDENADLYEESLQVLWNCIDDVGFVQTEANTRKHRELCFMLIDQFNTRAQATVLLELASSDGQRGLRSVDPLVSVAMTDDPTDAIRQRGDYRVDISAEAAERLGLAPDQTVVQIVEPPVSKHDRWIVGISVGCDDNTDWTMSEKGNPKQ